MLTVNFVHWRFRHQLAGTFLDDGAGGMARKWRCLIVAVLLFALTGCEDGARSEGWHTDGNVRTELNQQIVTTLTIGDVDPDTPSNRVKNMRPLADHIARELGWQPERVRVRIARSIDEVSMMMRDEQVDLFIDSGFPSLFVRRNAGSKVILEALVDGQREYGGVIITASDSPIRKLQDLHDQVIAFQERYSTSAYLLPLSLLQKEGLTMQYIGGAGGRVDSGNVGFLFSGDDENTLAILREGMVAAGAISSPDFERLPDSVKAELNVIAKTQTVPRKLVSIRPGLDPDLERQLTRALTSVDDEDRQQMINADAWYWEFRRLEVDTVDGLELLEQVIDQSQGVLAN